jgi:serine/threonine protein kinase
MGSAAGRRLGRYEVVKHLASGGMAQVLLARATGIEGFERYVVIKQIHVERANDPTVVKMFLDEARLAASLHHANIVQVHDIGQEAGEYYFAMEYLHGEDLRGVLHKHAVKHEYLPLEHVITIITSAAAALHHAHEQLGPDRLPRGIVHRDVSPANIFVCYDGTVKVVDFGIAKAAHRTTQTHSGTLKGKIAYMAPEHCLGKEVDRRSDIFALGIVLYELYTVRRLFKGASEFITMSAIVSGKIPPPSQHRPEIPPQLEAIIMKALATAPADRYQTAGELRVALDRLADELGLRTSTTALADYLAQKLGRRPEPWLDEDSHEINITDVDFDGSGEGLVAAPETPALATLAPAPGSLMARAQERAHRTSTSEWSPVRDDMPTTASGTKMAWSTPMPPPPRRRSIAFAVGGACLALAGGAAFLLASSGGSQVVEPTSGTSSSITMPTSPPPPPPAPPPPAPPLPPPVVPAAIEAPPKQAPPIVAKKKPVATKPKPQPKSPDPSEPAPAYDPDSLFLKKPTP